MIPLITHTPHLQILAASRALLTAEQQKPHYFPILLGAALPAHWPPTGYARADQPAALVRLPEGGRDAAGWHGWYALRKADDAALRTLVGEASFFGPPDAAGTAEFTFAVADDWRGQGLGTELVAGLVQQAADTRLVSRLVAHVAPNGPASKALLRNGFGAAGAAENGRQRYERAIEPSSATPPVG